MTHTSNSEVTIDAVMREIFMACDRNNCGKVPVSHLIEYITPFLRENLDNLAELKMALNPKNVDVEIDQATFYKYMREWAQKINAENCTNKSYNLTSASPSGDLAKEFSLHKSILESSFESGLLKCYVESSTFNLSASSEQSICNEIDKSILEEQIKELLHRNKKINDELGVTRSLYCAIEEQNDSFQMEMKILEKQLLQEREVNKGLQKGGDEWNNLREVTISAQNHVAKMKRAMRGSDKEILRLKQSQSTLEFEKQQLEEKLFIYHEKMQDTVNAMVQLQLDVKLRDKEISCLEEVNTGLKSKVHEQETAMNDFEECIHCLKIEKEKLQKKVLSEIIKQQLSSMNAAESSSCKHEETESESKKNYSNISLSESTVEDMDLLSRNSNVQHESLDAEFLNLGSIPLKSINKECQVNNIDEEQLSSINKLILQVTTLTDENIDLAMKNEAEKYELQKEITKRDDNNNNFRKLIDNLLVKLDENEIKRKELMRKNKQTVEVYENKLNILEEEIQVFQTEKVKLLAYNDHFNNVLSNFEDEVDNLRVDIFKNEQEGLNLKERTVTVCNNLNHKLNILSKEKFELKSRLCIEKFKKSVILEQQELVFNGLKTKLRKLLTAITDANLKHETSCKELNAKINAMAKNREELNNKILEEAEKNEKLSNKYKTLRKKRNRFLMREGRLAKFRPVRNATYGKMEKRVENFKLRVDELEEELKNEREWGRLYKEGRVRIQEPLPDVLGTESKNIISTSSNPFRFSSYMPYNPEIANAETQDLNESSRRQFEEIHNINLSEEELEESVEELFFEYQLDRIRIKEKFENSFKLLNSAELKIIGITQEMLKVIRNGLTGSSLQKTDTKLKGFLKNSMLAIRLAEQYGAIRENHLWLNKFSVTIDYIDNIKRKLENLQELGCANCNRQLKIDKYLAPMLRRQDKWKRCKFLLRTYILIFLLALASALFMSSQFHAPNLFQLTLESHSDWKYSNGSMPM